MFSIPSLVGLHWLMIQCSISRFLIAEICINWYKPKSVKKYKIVAHYKLSHQFSDGHCWSSDYLRSNVLEDIVDKNRSTNSMPTMHLPCWNNRSIGLSKSCHHCTDFLQCILTARHAGAKTDEPFINTYYIPIASTVEKLDKSLQFMETKLRADQGWIRIQQIS